MEIIYQEAIQAVEDGAKFDIDLCSRSLKLNGKHIIEDGKYEGELGVSPCSEEEFLSNVERLYGRYKHSVPSERSESKARRYFRALSEKDLSDEDMLYGEHREKMQIALELYILCQVINGFPWNAKTMGSWFWQSRKDKDLVILRCWIEPVHNKPFNNHQI